MFGLLGGGIKKFRSDVDQILNNGQISKDWWEKHLKLIVAEGIKYGIK